ncbi:hypothetical protein GCM10027061_17610 [Nesterenkonia suensis]
MTWDPNNSMDVSQVGCTGEVYVDTYTLDGELLNRIELGPNIRAGAHYTQFLVYDFDGDGTAEIMMKSAPGTVADDGEHITMPQEDLDAGYSHEDDHRMSADDYYEHVVEVFCGWHERPEVVAGNWPETLEEAFGEEPSYDYPLGDADTRQLADHFIDDYVPERSDRNDLRTFEGFIVHGPECLTVFDGETGTELDTVPYTPERGVDGLMWGDYAMSRVEPGNRVDRFLTGVAHLDGQAQSAVAAYDFDGNQEIIYGSATLDHDGSLLYSSTGIGHPGSPIAGKEAPLGHGGALHVEHFDPAREGQEIFSVHEAGPWAPYGSVMRDAATGETLWGDCTGTDVGRGMVGDIDPEPPGYHAWVSIPPNEEEGATGLWTADGEAVEGDVPGTNMSSRWAADMTTQIIVGARESTLRIEDWQDGILLEAEGPRTNNYTKGNPSLVADIFGDWREELVLRTSDSSALRIHTATEVTDGKLYTLMHDPQYQVGWPTSRPSTISRPTRTSTWAMTSTGGRSRCRRVTTRAPAEARRVGRFLARGAPVVQNEALRAPPFGREGDHDGRTPWPRPFHPSGRRRLDGHRHRRTHTAERRPGGRHATGRADRPRTCRRRPSGSAGRRPGGHRRGAGRGQHPWAW